MTNNFVSAELGEALLQSQDNLQRILENMVLLGEPAGEYERLMFMLSYLDQLADDLQERADIVRGGHGNVVYLNYEARNAGTNKKNR